MTPESGATAWVPDACTLPTVEQPLRTLEFATLLGETARRVHRRSATRLEVVIPAAAESAARDLARRESECCAFFAFSFEGDADDTVMGIEVPPAHSDILDAMQARAAR
ncbi:hypothetical protein H0264_00765 [Nocardia huaxiensis]|uniref:Arsenate reductase n=1 Tax=Nocardia huaxiensis TaxID=2755382 RepID=A0A7D6VAS0_9NOCA|nr:hypothetical protein [Nocardia huaxiensis]QLY30974.1 hypothetical protein H0264_00765 [Nocardia huaxiensis]